MKGVVTGIKNSVEAGSTCKHAAKGTALGDSLWP